MCLYLTPNAADQFLSILKYFGKAPPDLQRTQDNYRADFYAWNEQHAVYSKDMARWVNSPAEMQAPNSGCRPESHRADGPTVSGNGAQYSTRGGDDVVRSPATATDLPGLSESAPTLTLKEHIGQDAERLTDQVMQLVASEADVKKQLEELAASNQAEQQALEERKRQLLEEQEKLEKHYAEQRQQLEQKHAALQGRRHQVALQLSELTAAQPQTQQAHVEGDSSRQVNSSAPGGGDEAYKDDDAARQDAVSIHSDSEEDVPLKRRRSRMSMWTHTVNSDDDDDDSLASHRRASPATCSATASQGDNTPSAAFHLLSQKKPRVAVGKKGETYAAKRFAERVPDNRSSSEFFHKLGLDKFTVLSRARDMRADPRVTGTLYWRMDLYWTHNPSASGADQFKEGEYAGSEANREVMLIQKGVLQLKDLPEAEFKEEYYSVGKKAVKKDIKEVQEVRSKYAEALRVSASKPREKNKYTDVPRAEIVLPEP